MLARSALAKNFQNARRSTQNQRTGKDDSSSFDCENTTSYHIYLLMETYSEKMKRKREEANAAKKQLHPVKKSKLLPDSVDKTVVVLLGPPAIGKGTQATLLSKKYSLHHISMGELLRAASEEKGERGQYIREHWTLKDLNEIAFQLLQTEIQNHLTDDKVKGFIIDGTPKTIEGAFQLNTVLTDFGLKVTCVFLMEIADLDVLSNRLKQRIEDSKEKQRNDDKEGTSVLDVRLANFFKQIELVQQYYGKLGLLFKIDAAHEKEVVFEAINSVMNDLAQRISINQTRVAHEKEVAMKFNQRQLKSDQLNTDLVGDIVQNADQWSHMLNQLLKCCRAKIWTFPGKIPVNVTKQSMLQMTSEDWLVTSKANGTRYLLFIHQQKAYFINRKLDFFHAPQVNVSTHQLYSIIDGEMVIEAADETSSDGVSSSLRFLVHDALYLDGKYVGGLTFVDRMQRVKTTVNKISSEKGHEYPAIFVSAKKYHPIYQLKHVISGVIPQERIKNDGLIFAYKYGKYKLGKDESTLKWKPLDQCTADYVAKNRTVLPNEEGGHKIRFELFVQKGPQLVQSDEYIVLDEKHELSDQLQEDMIVECQLVADVPQPSFSCIPLKIRTDKSHPNADWVLSSIKKTVLEWKDVDLKAIYEHFDLSTE